MFNISKRLNKFLACFLTALMLMSNTVALVPVYAAASANTNEQISELPEITLDKQVDDQFQNKQNTGTANLSTKQKAVQFINQLIPYYAQNGKQQGPEWLRTTDINLTFTEDLKPIYSLETLQPFTKEVTEGKLGFWQGRYAYQSGANSTANLGVGLRWLSEDKTSITGINTFYDYAFKHNLSRVGVGAEYFNKQAEYRANFYIPTSGDRQTGATALDEGMLYSYIRAVSGFDYEVGSTLANAPWLSLYASGFHYDNKHKEDENGYRLRSKMQLTPRLSMEMGYTDSNLTSGNLYGKVLYQLADTAGPALHGGSAKEPSNDISYKLLQKVQRENDIKTETFTKLVAYTGSLSVTVTSSSGAALQGAQVQAYQNGSPVGAAAVTDANGIAVISGLAAGDYTVRATYFSDWKDSSAVTVQKDQTANTAITLDVVGGKALIHVLDNAGSGVGGATVTAEAADGLHGAADKSLFDRILGVKTVYAASGFKVTAATDANGIARFDNLPPGNYKFTVTYSGKEMKSLAVAVADGSTSNSTVVLPASGGNIVAMIIDAVSKAAISGAAVELKSGSTVIETKNTDSDGTAIFSGLTAGSNYTVAASAANYSGKSISTTATDKETVAAEIALTPQDGGATIKVTDEANAPIDGATVSVTVNGKAQTVTTADNGEAAFMNLPIGTYTFTATKAGYSSGTAKDVTIASGATATVDIALTRQTGGATITVTDGTNPVSGATVSVTVNSKEQIATTADNGVVTFANIPTGTYTFTATKADYGSGAASDVVIANGATATATIALARQTGSAKIMVTDGTAPLSGVAVSVPVNGQEQTATTADNGEATFANLPTGTYTFTATKAGYGSGSANDVAISNGAEASAAITLIRQTGGAKITVKDAVNAPIKGVTVSVTVNDKEEKVTTGTNGEATFTNIPTGTYTFTTTMAGYVSGAANDVVIGNGAEATAAITLTRKLVNVTIAVIDYEDKQPIGEANVTVTVEGAKISALTDSGGIATFPNLSSGYYTFIVTKVGYSKSSLSTNIVDTTTESINMIRPKGQITITVKGTDGNPISGVDVSTMVEIVDKIKPVTKTTNASGIAVFTELPTKQYTFTATKAGYDSNTTAVTVLGDQQKAGTITLSPKLITAQVNVKDGDGKNMVSYTSVRVTGNGVDQTEKTDASGNVTFNLPAGEYTFTATYQYDGFYTNASKTIVLSDETSSVNLTMVRKVGSITLIVKDKNSQQPISGAEISESYSEPKKVLGYTDGEGKLTLTNVPTGSYYYTANKYGYQGMINGVDVNEGTNEKVIELPSLPTGKLTITVKDNDIGASGQLEGATVTVKGNGVSQTASTDAFGMAVFLNLPIGGYTVSVSRANYTNASTDLTLNEGNNSKTIYITASFLDIGLYVTESGTMSMLGGVKVTITHESGVFWTQTSTAGVNMIFSNVPRGKYTFVLEKAGYTTITQDREITRKDGANAPVFVMFKN